MSFNKKKPIAKNEMPYKSATSAVQDHLEMLSDPTAEKAVVVCVYVSPYDSFSASIHNGGTGNWSEQK